MHLEMKHGSGITPYYTTIINSTIDHCQFVNGTDKNPILKMIVESVFKSAPHLVRPCPLVGRFKAYNLSIALSGVFSQFLKGRYKTCARWYDDKDENIITFKIGNEW